MCIVNRVLIVFGLDIVTGECIIAGVHCMSIVATFFVVAAIVAYALLQLPF